MIVNVEFLKKKNACTKGMKEFEKLFPLGFNMSEWTRKKQIEIIKTPLRKYIAWAYYNNIIPLWSMRNANLRNADLSNAVLRGADLSNAVLSGANLSGAYINYNPNIDGYNFENGRLWEV